MDQNFIGPDNLPDNDTIDLGAADEAAILAAETSWRRSLKTNVEGEAAWDAAVGTALQAMANGTDSVAYLPKDHPRAEEGNEETSRMYAASALMDVIIDARQVHDTNTASLALAYLDELGQLANAHRATFREMLRRQ